MNQNKTKIIGLTGGVATGKSTVSGILKGLGCKVIDADEIARDVVQKGYPAYNGIVNVFGKGMLDDHKNIDRKKLGDIIFKDDHSRKALNAIIHPYVFQAIRDLMDKHKENAIVFLDIPLLIEEIDKFSEYGIILDEIWLVYIDEDTQLQRLIGRDLISIDKAYGMINSQMPIELKREYADRIIDNGGDKIQLKQQVKNLLNEII